MSIRYLKISEIVSFDMSGPVLELIKPAGEIVIIPEFFINCGQRRRVV